MVVGVKVFRMTTGINVIEKFTFPLGRVEILKPHNNAGWFLIPGYLILFTLFVSDGQYSNNYLFP